MKTAEVMEARGRETPQAPLKILTGRSSKELTATNLCSPCSDTIKYDILAKIETLDRDDAHIKEYAGIQDLLPKLKQLNSHRPRSERIELLYNKYFSKLPQKLLDDLYEMYKYDFKLFGYEVKNNEFVTLDKE